LALGQISGDFFFAELGQELDYTHMELDYTHVYPVPFNVHVCICISYENVCPNDRELICDCNLFQTNDKSIELARF